MSRLRTLARPAAILALAWGWFLLYAYPGTITFDALDELIQARAGNYRDDQPPAVAALWRLVEHVIAGPAGMLVIQSLAFLVGLYLVFRRTFAPRGAAWAAAAVFVFPPVMMPMSAIWKDCLMAGFLMLGIGALLARDRRLHVLALVAMFGATAMRYNAAAATLVPVVLLFDWGFAGVRRYALAAAAWLVVTAAAFGLNSALADRPAYAWHSTVAIYDVVGTLAHVDGDIPDAELAELLAGSDLLVTHDIHATARAIYTPRDYLTPLTDPERALWHLSIKQEEPPSEAFRAAIARTWWRLVTTHPFAYLEHRLAAMELVLDRGAGAIPWRGFNNPNLRASMGLPTKWWTIQTDLTWRVMTPLERHTAMFSPWVYLLVALALLALAWRERDVLVLLASGLLYEGTLVLLAATRDYRYSHWMIATTCIAVVTLTVRRARAKVPA